MANLPPPHDLPLTGLKARPPKPTPGKTPVPAKTVLPPPPKRRVSLNPQQEATLQVKQLLAPQYHQADVEAQRQNQAIQAYTTAVMRQLAGLGPSIGQDFSTAANQQQAGVDAAANALRAANPNGDLQSLLGAVGAPQAQQQQLAQNLGNTFNGGAAVGQYLGTSGVEPLRAQGLAAETLAKLQPGFTALAGRQSLLSALKSQSDARAQIGEQMPKLEQDWLTNFHTNQNQKAQIAAEREAAHLFDPTKSKALGYQVDGRGAPILNAHGQLQPIPGFRLSSNGQSVVKAYAPKGPTVDKIDSTVSSHSGRGIALDSRGKPVLVNGKTIPWTASTKTTIDKINPTVSSHAGRGIALNSQGKPVLLNGKTIPWGSGKPGAKTSSDPLRSGIANAFYGFTETKKVPVDKAHPDGLAKVYHPPLTFEEAVQHAVQSGYSRAAAVKMARRFGKPGWPGHRRRKGKQ